MSEPESKTEESTQPPPFTSNELDEIRQFLLAKRRALTTSQETRLNELSDPSDRHHLADLEEMGSDTLDTDSLCQIMDIEGSTVAQIDAAIEKIDAGSYGVCTDCGDVILKARLEALPFAALCIGCQRQKELSPEA